MLAIDDTEDNYVDIDGTRNYHVRQIPDVPASPMQENSVIPANVLIMLVRSKSNKIRYNNLYVECPVEVMQVSPSRQHNQNPPG